MVAVAAVVALVVARLTQLLGHVLWTRGGGGGGGGEGVNGGGGEEGSIWLLLLLMFVMEPKRLAFVVCWCFLWLVP